MAAVEFENPLGCVVEEVAIVRDGDDGAREAHEELFEPVDRFGVEVVGRFVEQQHVRLFEQQLAQRDAALFAARQVLDLRVPRRQAQRVGGHFELLLGAAAVARCEDRFVLRLFGRERVEIGVRLGVRRFNFKGGDQQKIVGNLSGGERGRLHLAKTLISGGNVLLLDEPSNDLDVETLRALEDALLEFAGSVMVISHDRWFLDRIATHILAFEGDSQVTFFDGNYQEYEADKRARLGEEAAKPKRLRYKPISR